MLGADVISPIDVPAWDNSAMDGYAVRAADTGDGVQLRINETVGAGHVATMPVTPGTATAIMTGAPIPDGADAVVVVEDTDGAREGDVTLHIEARLRQHIRPQGDDVQRGQVVLTRGQTLHPAAVAMAASVGSARLRVARAPKVAVLTTGDELVAPGRPLPPGAIYSSNDVAIAGLVREAGAVPDVRASAEDDPAALEAALEACLEADVVVSTGGVSVGVYDHVKEVFGRLGIQMDFWKVQMKPGKPLAFGTARRGDRVVPVFGLPGNPVSCMVNFYQFVRPWIRASMGDPTPYLPVVPAVAGEDIQSRPGRARLVRVVLEERAGTWVARRTGSQSSGVLTSMVRAHGLLLIASDARGPRSGEACRVQVLRSSFLSGATPGYGW